MHRNNFVFSSSFPQFIQVCDKLCKSQYSYFYVLKIPQEKGDPWEVRRSCCELLPHGSLTFSSFKVMLTLETRLLD